MKSHTFSDGKVMSYEDFGGESSRVILIHHGLVTSALEEEIWDSYYREKGMRLILPHRSGHEGSDYFEEASYLELGARFRTLLDSLGVERYAVCGISAGAPHAYASAFLGGAKVSGAYIYSGLGAIYEDEVLRGYGEYYEELKALYELARNSSPAEVGAFFAKKYSQYGGGLGGLIEKRALAIGYEITLQSRAWGFEPSAIKAPITIRHSRADTEVPFLAAQKTAQLIKGSEFIEVSDEPHFKEESFNEFLDLIVSRM